MKGQTGGAILCPMVVFARRPATRMVNDHRGYGFRYRKV
jgi:hypothetical protein